MLKECLTDPLFETQKRIYDQTRCSSMQLNNLHMQSPQDVLNFVPTLNGAVNMFKLKIEEQERVFAH